jgi:hypothetical protein
LSYFFAIIIVLKRVLRVKIYRANVFCKVMVIMSSVAYVYYHRDSGVGDPVFDIRNPCAVCPCIRGPCAMFRVPCAVCCVRVPEIGSKSSS